MQNRVSMQILTPDLELHGSKINPTEGCSVPDQSIILVLCLSFAPGI